MQTLLCLICDYKFVYFWGEHSDEGYRLDTDLRITKVYSNLVFKIWITWMAKILNGFQWWMLTKQFFITPFLIWGQKSISNVFEDNW